MASNANLKTIPSADDAKKGEPLYKGETIFSKAAGGGKSLIRMLVTFLAPMTIGFLTHYIGRIFFPGFGKPIGTAPLQIEFFAPLFVEIVALGIWLYYNIRHVNYSETTHHELMAEARLSGICAIAAGLVFGVMLGATIVGTPAVYWSAVLPVLAAIIDGQTAVSGSINNVIRKWSLPGATAGR